MTQQQEKKHYIHIEEQKIAVKTAAILGGRLNLHHLYDGFQTSIDSILLAAACPIHPGQSLLDLGCGVGSAGLSVACRVADITLTGIDIQPNAIALARHNATCNTIDQTSFQAQNIATYKEQNSVDHVICNPPYLPAGAHLRSPSASKATAMGFDQEMDLDIWIKTAHRALKNSGSFTMIHRADQLDTILRLYNRRFGAIEIFPIHPYGDQPAKRIIIRALKNRKTPLTLHAPLILHESKQNTDGTRHYTKQAESILRDMSAIYSG